MQQQQQQLSSSSPRHYSKMWPHLPGGNNNNGGGGGGGGAGSGSATTPPQPVHEDYRTAPWYWGSITKDQVHTILIGKPDGSFIVRDASSKNGDLTLTLTKDGGLFLIRILHCNGMYGFSSCNYSSVVDLIEFYMHNSLEVYNKDLNITLSNPVLRYDAEEGVGPIGGGSGSGSGGGGGGAIGSTGHLLDELRRPLLDFLTTHNSLARKQQHVDEKWSIFKIIEAELTEKRMHQDIFMRAEKMIKEQLKMLEAMMVDEAVIGGGPNAVANNASGTTAGGGGGGIVGPEEQEILKRNAAKLHDRLDALICEWDKLNASVEEKQETYKALERAINSTKPAITKQASKKEGLTEYLKAKGLKDEDLKDVIRMGFDAWYQHYQSNTQQPHTNENMWFIKDCTRADAEQLLHGAPTGTFLIRARPENYALSIVCNECVNHCIVYQEQSGYGFAAPYNIYATLKDLVQHYSTNSLEEHNDTLTTTLHIPVLHWQYNREVVLQQLQLEQAQAAAEAAADAASRAAAIEAEAAFNAAAKMNAGGSSNMPYEELSAGVAGVAAAMTGPHIYEVIGDEPPGGLLLGPQSPGAADELQQPLSPPPSPGQQQQQQQ